MISKSMKHFSLTALALLILVSLAEGMMKPGKCGDCDKNKVPVVRIKSKCWRCEECMKHYKSEISNKSKDYCQGCNSNFPVISVCYRIFAGSTKRCTRCLDELLEPFEDHHAEERSRRYRYAARMFPYTTGRKVKVLLTNGKKAGHGHWFRATVCDPPADELLLDPFVLAPPLMGWWVQIENVKENKGCPKHLLKKGHLVHVTKRAEIHLPRDKCDIKFKINEKIFCKLTDSSQAHGTFCYLEATVIEKDPLQVVYLDNDDNKDKLVKFPNVGQRGQFCMLNQKIAFMENEDTCYHKDDRKPAPNIKRRLASTPITCLLAEIERARNN